MSDAVRDEKSRTHMVRPSGENTVLPAVETPDSTPGRGYTNGAGDAERKLRAKPEPPASDTVVVVLATVR